VLLLFPESLGAKKKRKSAAPLFLANDEEREGEIFAKRVKTLGEGALRLLFSSM